MVYVFRCKKCGHRFRDELKNDELMRPIMPMCPKCGGDTVIEDFLVGVI